MSVKSYDTCNIEVTIPTDTYCAAAAGGKGLLCFTFRYIFMMYSMDPSQVAIINSMVLF